MKNWVFIGEPLPDLYDVFFSKVYFDSRMVAIEYKVQRQNLYY